jgi:NADH-quinone oxidoreductase subunit A
MNVAQDYLPILVFLAIGFGLSIFLIALSFMRATRKNDAEKLSPYECGFDPFDAPKTNARIPMDAKFYLVAILFIIFDLEVAFLFPWAVTLSKIGTFGFFSMMLFLGVLTVGFVYEWKKGALEWR